MDRQDGRAVSKPDWVKLELSRQIESCPFPHPEVALRQRILLDLVESCSSQRQLTDLVESCRSSEGQPRPHLAREREWRRQRTVARFSPRRQPVHRRLLLLRRQIRPRKENPRVLPHRLHQFPISSLPLRKPAQIHAHIKPEALPFRLGQKCIERLVFGCPREVGAGACLGGFDERVGE